MTVKCKIAARNGWLITALAELLLTYTVEYYCSQGTRVIVVLQW